MERIYEPDCECSADYNVTDNISLLPVKYYPCPLHPDYGQPERRDFRANPCDYLDD